MLSRRNKEFVQIGVSFIPLPLVSIPANLYAVKSIPQGDFIFRLSIRSRGLPAICRKHGGAKNVPEMRIYRSRKGVFDLCVETKNRQRGRGNRAKSRQGEKAARPMVAIRCELWSHLYVARTRDKGVINAPVHYWILLNFVDSREPLTACIEFCKNEWSKGWELFFVEICRGI